MKILTVLGARPQFVKGAVLSRQIQSASNGLEEIIVHTGQHYDSKMSDVFFEELSIPKPKYNLGVNGGSHGEMTGKMLHSVEQVVFEEKPDCLLVYGDTNSTLAGALVASKLHIPIAHVEAGLRSFNMEMPEEVNRILTDRVSQLLLCPTEEAVKNLKAEGLTDGVKNVGDIMFDAALYYKDKAEAESLILEELGIVSKSYILVTCHRQDNTDDKSRLEEIFSSLNQMSEEMPVVFPVHPRTRKKAEEFDLLSKLSAKVMLIEPVSFLDMVRLEKNSALIVTDSGGVQKEAFFYGVPCITMRDQTEWVETIHIGANVLVGADSKKIMDAYSYMRGANLNRAFEKELYGDGGCAGKVIAELAAL